ncbi:MAG: SMC-Scp complex subunit ScpB [Candidatus Omnitrophica bacterium]|nr:SMC-Scp complex subunit ScpB [Candidatus Omnitrophota bacterium]MDD5487575.1 SMC-Scp complex subunit ScpB [Candidatus Omnitrophota bacterium]
MDRIGKLKSIIEALLIVSEEGIKTEDLKGAIEEFDLKEINEALESLSRDYEAPERAFKIAEIAGRHRIVTKPEYQPWINRLYEKESDRLTGPSLETLAIIAYKQPVTRAEIESVRGVNAGGVIKTIIDKGLIQIKGRKNVIGKPLLYGTTEKFLEVFGLGGLDELPALREFSEEELDYGRHEDVLPVGDDKSEYTDVEEDRAFLEFEEKARAFTGENPEPAGDGDVGTGGKDDMPVPVAGPETSEEGPNAAGGMDPGPEEEHSNEREGHEPEKSE